MLAFTFPGQGSQRPGMGAAWVGHPSFELVEQASDVIGRDVRSLLLDAGEATLTHTANAQVATFVLGLVILDAIERLGIEPSACAGHSLGEYTALVACGSLSYDDGLRLVAERGNAMADAAEQNPGSMCAVLGLDDDSVEAACLRAEGDVWVANFNAPGQVVIAGSRESLAAAGEIAKSLGARRILSFPVGGAFHTPYMAPARERLRKVLGEVVFEELDPIVVANVDARAHADPADWPSLLSAQLCGPVRWRQSLSTLFDLGVTTFVEVGPGGVLTGLVKRVLTSEPLALNVATPADLEVLVERIAHLEVLAPGPEPLPQGGDYFTMTERLVVSPATGLFRPLETYLPAAPRLLGEPGAGATPTFEVAVGDLIGYAGETEIRSPFAGELKGIIVLSGERVVTGQPVAWLRAADDRPGPA